jgi:hypothetical protein
MTETGASISNLVPRDGAAIGSCRRDLLHQRTPEDSAGDPDEAKRLLDMAGTLERFRRLGKTAQGFDPDG